MLFDSEPEAFAAYARAMPGNCVLLVDTYDTLQGVRHAIEVGRRLRAEGSDLAGIRLDSGDLAWLSQRARQMLDEAGFAGSVIVGSNELDELVIDSLKEQGARISVWGVGTRLVTGADDGALGGVYKLSASRRPGEPWKHRLKLSEQAAKVSIPGLLQVRRFEGPEGHVADAIWDELTGIPEEPVIVDPLDHTRRREMEGAPHQDLLLPVYRGGKLVYQRPPLEAVRARTLSELAKLHKGIKRFVNPHQYPVGLEKRLFDLRTRLVLEARGLPEE
jgi:nicotinate phosphoribosyltransferase